MRCPLRRSANVHVFSLIVCALLSQTGCCQLERTAPVLQTPIQTISEANLEAKTIPSRVVLFAVPTEAPNNLEAPFFVRLPLGFSTARAEFAQILVVFGGRNWAPERTLKEYGFDAWADKHGIIILAPWFMDDMYWEPEIWSGHALDQALAHMRRQ